MTKTRLLLTELAHLGARVQFQGNRLQLVHQAGYAPPPSLVAEARHRRADLRALLQADLPGIGLFSPTGIDFTAVVEERLAMVCIDGHVPEVYGLAFAELQIQPPAGLSYRSQSENAFWRSVRQAQKIRTQLGGDPSIYSPFPPRPRGIHRRRYKRLSEEAAVKEGVFWTRKTRPGR